MARPKLGDSETQRLQLKITEEEIAAIDDWRFANRVPSRSEAVRRLCQTGLDFHRLAYADGQHALEMAYRLIRLRKDGVPVDPATLDALIDLLAGLSGFSGPALRSGGQELIDEAVKADRRLTELLEASGKQGEEDLK